MKKLPLLMTVCFLGCSAGEDGARSRPLSCDPATRQGSYFADFTTLSGDCGEQTSGLIRLDADAPLGACALTRDDRWSDGNCTLERSTVCPFDVLEPGATVETTGISTQEDSAGDVLTGTLTMTIRDGAGLAVCFGSYRISAVRQ